MLRTLRLELEKRGVKTNVEKKYLGPALNEKLDVDLKLQDND